MSTVTIQTKNVDVKIKNKAEKVIKDAGLSSLQDVIRIMIIDIANGRLPLRIDWGTVKDEELKESIQDYKDGKLTKIKAGQKLSEVIGTK